MYTQDTAHGWKYEMLSQPHCLYVHVTIKPHINRDDGNARTSLIMLVAQSSSGYLASHKTQAHTSTSLMACNCIYLYTIQGLLRVMC